MTCTVPDCGRPAVRRGRCWTHERRERLGQPVDVPVRERHPSLWARVLEAAIALADAESDEDEQRAGARLRQAMKDWKEVRRA